MNNYVSILPHSSHGRSMQRLISTPLIECLYLDTHFTVITHRELLVKAGAGGVWASREQDRLGRAVALLLCAMRGRAIHVAFRLCETESWLSQRQRQREGGERERERE